MWVLTPRRRAIRLIAVIAVLGLALIMAVGPAPAAGAVTAASIQGTLDQDVHAAAQVGQAQGYRVGVAVLDLRTGQYAGAGEDTASFASESVAKVLIATELLATGQMTGQTESTAYQMITESDDADADSLYGLVGDSVIDWVADHYHLSGLGTPPDRPGYWGNTEINAKGMVYLYAAIAKDPAVGPWLINAMAHTTEIAADGTNQFFGLPSATTGAAVKQGWGDDGDDSPNAVFNTTGYLDNDQYAVAILTDGPPDSYGDQIAAAVSAEAKALLPGGTLPPAVAPSAPAKPSTQPASASAARVAAAAATSAPGADAGSRFDTPGRASSAAAVPVAGLGGVPRRDLLLAGAAVLVGLIVMAITLLRRRGRARHASRG